MKTKHFLSWFSCGKYKTVLYHKGRNFYASPTSGCITIFFIVIIVIYAFTTLLDIINRENWVVDEKDREL